MSVFLRHVYQRTVGLFIWAVSIHIVSHPILVSRSLYCEHKQARLSIQGNKSHTNQISLLRSQPLVSPSDLCIPLLFLHPLATNEINSGQAPPSLLYPIHNSCLSSHKNTSFSQLIIWDIFTFDQKWLKNWITCIINFGFRGETEVNQNLIVKMIMQFSVRFFLIFKWTRWYFIKENQQYTVLGYTYRLIKTAMLPQTQWETDFAIPIYQY